MALAISSAVTRISDVSRFTPSNFAVYDRRALSPLFLYIVYNALYCGDYRTEIHLSANTQTCNRRFEIVTGSLNNFTTHYLSSLPSAFMIATAHAACQSSALSRRTSFSWIRGLLPRAPRYQLLSPIPQVRSHKEFFLIPQYQQ